MAGEVQHGAPLDRVVDDGAVGKPEGLELCLCDGVCQGVARRDVDQGGLGDDPLAYAKKRLKLSQAALATRLGVDQSTVQRIEAGKRPPSGPVQMLLEQIIIKILVKK